LHFLLSINIPNPFPISATLPHAIAPVRLPYTLQKFPGKNLPHMRNPTRHWAFITMQLLEIIQRDYPIAKMVYADAYVSTILIRIGCVKVQSSVLEDLYGVLGAITYIRTSWGGYYQGTIYGDVNVVFNAGNLTQAIAAQSQVSRS